jgi:hypothetical protein
MNKQMHRLEREKLLLRYTTALDAGDFDTVALVLQMAEQDAELERMILEINDVMASELEEATDAQEDETVRELIHTHLRSALSEVVPELPPLTVGHVMARIHADAALAGKVERETLAATRSYQTADTPLPTDLSLRGVGKLLERLGLKVGRRFQDIFRETAIFMRMGRNQGMARLAATRRQQATSRPSAGMVMMAAPTPDEIARATSAQRMLHEAANEDVYKASGDTPADKPDDRQSDQPDNQHNDPSTGRPDEETK